MGQLVFLWETTPVVKRNPDGSVRRRRMGYFRCSCGNVFIRRVGSCGGSCGCSRGPSRIDRVNHGLSGDPLYGVWKRIKNSCYNRKAENYHLYGGRGVGMYRGWRNDFRTFYNHVMGLPDVGGVLVLVDRDGDYAPGNVEWISIEENRRRRILREMKERRQNIW